MFFAQTRQSDIAVVRKAGHKAKIYDLLNMDKHSMRYQWQPSRRGGKRPSQ